MTRIEKHTERYQMARCLPAKPEEMIRRMDRAAKAIRLRKERTRKYARILGIA